MAAYKDEKRGTWYVSFHYYDWTGKNCRKVKILIFCVADRMVCARIGVIFLILDLILIAIKNRCPFCHKSLRIAPIRGEEYCPYCGSKIE